MNPIIYTFNENKSLSAYHDEVIKTLDELRNKYRQKIIDEKFVTISQTKEHIKLCENNYYKVEFIADDELNNMITSATIINSVFKNILSTFKSKVFIFDRLYYVSIKTNYMEEQKLLKNLKKETDMNMYVNELDYEQDLYNDDFCYNLEFVFFFEDKNEAVQFKLIQQQLINDIIDAHKDL